MTGNIRWQRLDAVLPNERFNKQVRKKAVLRHECTAARLHFCIKRPSVCFCHLLKDRSFRLIQGRGWMSWTPPERMEVSVAFCRPVGTWGSRKKPAALT